MFATFSLTLQASRRLPTIRVATTRHVGGGYIHPCDRFSRLIVLPKVDSSSGKVIVHINPTPAAARRQHA